MLEMGIAAIVVIALVATAWYALKSSAASQSRTEAALAATEQADRRNLELEDLRRANTRKVQESDYREATKVTSPADAAKFLQDSFAIPDHDAR